jgi:hypothetical protein
MSEEARDQWIEETYEEQMRRRHGLKQEDRSGAAQMMSDLKSYRDRWAREHGRRGGDLDHKIIQKHGPYR